MHIKVIDYQEKEPYKQAGKFSTIKKAEKPVSYKEQGKDLYMKIGFYRRKNGVNR